MTGRVSIGLSWLAHGKGLAAPKRQSAGAAGVDVGIRRVQLPNSDVFANAYLYADLDNVPRIVDRLVLALDRNPEILTQVLMTVDTAVNAVG